MPGGDGAGVGTTKQLLSDLPWDVLVLLVGLGLLSEVFVHARLFGILAVLAARWSRARPTRVLICFAVGMYVVSGLVNNLTALILVLPVLLILLKLMSAPQRYVSWTLGVLLVACNLGGAATPIGDFPAILLLGSGRMLFREYLIRAMPPTLIGLGVLSAAVVLFVRPQRGLEADPLTARLSVQICAGSSLLLTAATSGLMAQQALTERGNLRDPQGRPVRFGFFEFLPVGLLSFVMIQLIALGYAAWSIR